MSSCHSNPILRDKEEGDGENENGASTIPLDQYADVINQQFGAQHMLRRNGQVRKFLSFLTGFDPTFSYYCYISFTLSFPALTGRRIFSQHSSP